MMPKNGANAPLPSGGSWSGRTPIESPRPSASSSARTPLRSLGTSFAPNRSRPRFITSSHALPCSRYIETIGCRCEYSRPASSQEPRCGEAAITPLPAASARSHSSLAAHFPHQPRDPRRGPGPEHRQLDERLARLDQCAEDEPLARRAAERGETARDVKARAAGESVGDDPRENADHRAERVRDRQRQAGGASIEELQHGTGVGGPVDRAGDHSVLTGRPTLV